MGLYLVIHMWMKVILCLGTGLPFYGAHGQGYGRLCPRPPCRGWDSNSRPCAYELNALPLDHRLRTEPEKIQFWCFKTYFTWIRHTLQGEGLLLPYKVHECRHPKHITCCLSQRLWFTMPSLPQYGNIILSVRLSSRYWNIHKYNLTVKFLQLKLYNKHNSHPKDCSKIHLNYLMVGFILRTLS